MGFLGGWINVTTVSIALFTVYFAFTTQQLYGIMYPSFEDVDGPTLDPLWPEGEHLHSELYLSSRREWDAERDFADPFVLRVGDFSDLTLDWQDNARFTELNVSRASLHRLQKQEHGDDAAAADALWRALRSNGTVYLHVHVTRRGFSPNPAHATYAPLATVHQSNPLTRYAPRPNAKNATYLLAPYFPQYYPPEDTSELYNEVDPSDEGEDPAKTADVISFWKPHMAIRMVTDFTKYPHQEIPPLVFPNLRYHQMRDHSYKYTPSMYLDDMGLTMDKLVPLNRTVRELPLKISYEPMSYARWQILLTMEMAFKTQEAMGFTTNDLDSMRGMIADTNPYLLAVTMTVSLLHILFDWLAFKNDISDWRQRTSEREMVGVSLRAMVISLVSQAIICLYLLEEKTTLLILGPSIISLVLLVWKIFKVWRATSRAKASPTKSVMSTTRRADAMATNHLLFALAPLIVGFAAYSLVHKKHVSWYSWLLGSFTGAVYAFGFVLMTPQLVINYQLKSVAHLQWRYLIYRALNTFIDDLFAFIIHMPTMHRLSCFRDDIIFLIYVYQRWIYPVDKGRKFDDDDGAQGEGEGKASEIKADKKND